MEDPRRVRHLKRVERRAKFLATLTPHQRRVRDNYIAWVRWWRKEYKNLVSSITNNKKFIRTGGHNNLASLKIAMRRLEEQKLKARTMLMARVAAKGDYSMQVEKPRKVA